MNMREIPKKFKRAKLSVSILCLLSSACVGTPLPPDRPFSQIPIEKGLHKLVYVTASGPWQDSGVILQAEDELFIDAKGTWSGGPGWESGPRGAIGPDAGRIYPPEPAATALIGKIGSGNPFTVGDQYLGKAAQEGTLFLRMNDPTTWDNSGQLTVDIYVQNKNKAQFSNTAASATKSEQKDMKDLPKIAVWDLTARNTPITNAQELTSILVSELTKIRKYEVYSQENVRTLAGWTEERMKLGCTSTQCLTALGQMDVAKLISGSVGKIGNTYSISLNLFDTQNGKAENSISEFCRSEDELINLVQQASRKLLGAPSLLKTAIEKEGAGQEVDTSQKAKEIRLRRAIEERNLLKQKR